jgi:hypothetical protein
VLQKFIIQEATKKLKINGLIAQIAMGTSTTAEQVHKVTSLWNDYVSLELGYPVDTSTAQPSVSSKEEAMFEEYARISTLRPTMKMDDRGNYVVSGMNI